MKIGIAIGLLALLFVLSMLILKIVIDIKTNMLIHLDTNYIWQKTEDEKHIQINLNERVNMDLIKIPEEEIIKILAKHYNLKPSQVTLHTDYHFVKRNGDKVRENFVYAITDSVK